MGAAGGAAAGAPAAGVGAIPGGIAGGAAGAIGGGALGGLIAEMIAEKIEPGGLKRAINPARVAVATALGGVPGSATVRAGKPALSVALGALQGYAGTAGYKLADEGKNAELNPLKWSSSELLTGPLLGGGIAGGFAKLFPKGKAPSGEPKPTNYNTKDGLRVALDTLKQHPKGDVPYTAEEKAMFKALVESQAKDPSGPIASEIGPRLVSTGKRDAAGNIIWKPPSLADMEAIHDGAIGGIVKETDNIKKGLMKEGTQLTRNENERRKFITNHLIQDTKNQRATSRFVATQAKAGDQALGEVIKDAKDTERAFAQSLKEKVDLEKAHTVANKGVSKDAVDTEKAFNQALKEKVDTNKAQEAANTMVGKEKSAAEKARTGFLGDLERKFQKALTYKENAATRDAALAKIEAIKKTGKAGPGSITESGSVDTGAGKETFRQTIQQSPVAPPVVDDLARTPQKGTRPPTYFTNKKSAHDAADATGGVFHQDGPRRYSVRYPDPEAAQDLAPPPPFENTSATRPQGPPLEGPVPSSRVVDLPDLPRSAPEGPPPVGDKLSLGYGKSIPINTAKYSDEANAQIQRLWDDMHASGDAGHRREMGNEIRRIITAEEGRIASALPDDIPQGLSDDIDKLAAEEAAANPPAQPDLSVENFAKALTKEGETPIAPVPFQSGKIAGSKLPTGSQSGLFGKGAPKDNLFEMMADPPTQAKPTEPAPAVPVRLYRSQADALGDQNPNGYRATKAAEDAGEIPRDDPHYKRTNKKGEEVPYPQGRPITPARMQGAGLRVASKATQEGPLAAERSGKWFSNKKDVADRYGRGKSVSYVDVPDDVAKNAMLKGSGGDVNQFILDDASQAGMSLVKEGTAPPKKGFTRLFRGMDSSEAAGKVDLDSSDLTKMTPEQRDKAIAKLVSDFKKNPKGGSTLSAMGAGQLENMLQIMKENPEYAGKLLGGLLGAGVGAYNNEDDPIKGLLIGGGLGYLGGKGVGKLAAQGKSLKELTDPLVARSPNYMRGALLSDPRSIVHNSIGGPIGSNFWGGVEQAAKGVVNRDPVQTQTGVDTLKSTRPDKWMKGFFNSLDDARERIHSSEDLGRVGQFIDPVNPGRFDRVVEGPATAMLAGDLNTKGNLMDAGVSEELAREITLTSNPKRALWKMIANIGKSKSGENDSGELSTLAQFIMPFKRTAANIMESGTERTPGLAWAINKWGDKTLRKSGKDIAVQQGIGGIVYSLGYAAGLATSQEAESNFKLQALVSNLGGQYSLLATTGFMAGQAVRNKGKTPVRATLDSTIENYTGRGFPLPTSEVLHNPASVSGKFLNGDELTGEDLTRAVKPGIPKLLTFLQEMAEKASR